MRLLSRLVFAGTGATSQNADYWLLGGLDDAILGRSAPLFPLISAHECPLFCHDQDASY